jgi:integrase
MARVIGRLSALNVSRAKEKGMLADGGGLYLQVGPTGSKSWIYRYMLNGRAREMGLGPLHTISLAEARKKAAECRKLKLEGIDPIEAQHAKRDAERRAAASSLTFKVCAERYIAAHRAGWRNAKHAAQWSSSLETYAYPVIGDLPVQSVEVGHVMKILEPIWATKTETASRVRGRIEAVLDWAAARGHRRGENPARWRGHLSELLPARSKVQKIKHHAALPYAEIGALVDMVRQQSGVAASALEFLILTATRTSETVEARWNEFDLKSAVWTIPAERMKAGKEHRVPLSGPALALLQRMTEVRHGDYVFPGGKAGRPLSNMALLNLLQRMECSDLTVHGFRSTFRDWAAERTNYPREVAEMALAHTVKDKVEAAYRRGDLFEKRGRLMSDWAAFCGVINQPGTVVRIGHGSGAA